MPDAPALQTARIPRLNVFRAGTWNGLTGRATLSQQDIDGIVRAFDRFSTGPRPFIQPVFCIGHDQDQETLAELGVPNAGLVTDLYAEGVDLFAVGEFVPPEVAAAVNAKRYNTVSVEMKPNVPDPETGEIWPWVLTRIAFLGAAIPGVKGLEPIPQLSFAAGDSPCVVFKFSEAPAVDRTAILQALTAAGQDVTAVTDTVPDSVLASWLAACQKASMASAPAPAIPPNPAPTVPPTPVTQVGYAAPTPGGTTTPAPVVPPKMADDPGDAAMKPAEMAAKFAEMKTTIETQGRQIVDLSSRLGSVAKFAETTQSDRKRERATAAVNDAVKAGKLFPAAKDATLGRLLRADSVVCFAEGTDKGKSEFDLQLAELAALPVVRKFGEQVPDPIAEGKGSAMSAERRAKLLGATPEGRAILKKQPAAAAA